MSCLLFLCSKMITIQVYMIWCFHMIELPNNMLLIVDIFSFFLSVIFPSQNFIPLVTCYFWFVFKILHVKWLLEVKFSTQFSCSIST
jgi:hypothetical protein